MSYSTVDLSSHNSAPCLRLEVNTYNKFNSIKNYHFLYDMLDD